MDSVAALAAKRVGSSSLPSRLAIVILTMLAAFLVSCSEGRKRPPGYLRLGHVHHLVGAAKELKDFDLILRRDEGGLYVMSTDCTYDLSKLVLRKTERGLVLVSTLSSSTYAIDGTVLSGPAKENLPYYELKFDSGSYGGPLDTLYVYIGREVKPSWRLPVTAAMLAAAETPAPEPTPVQ